MTTMDKVRPLLERLGQLSPNLYQKDFLLTWKQSDHDLESVLLIAEALEYLYRANISTRVFKGSLAVSNFRDKSTRTRFSFSSALAYCSSSSARFFIRK